MTLTPKQQEFYKALKSLQYDELCYGGGVAGGKSILSLGIAHKMAIDYAGCRPVIFRKNFTTITRNTVPSLREVIKLDSCENRVEIKSHSAVYKNGSEILFAEADETKDPDFNKLKGLNVTCGILEEGNELSFKAYNTIQTRVGRWNVINGEEIPRFTIITCNPADNWVKDMFYDNWANGTLPDNRYFLQSLPKDNPHNTEAYLKSLEILPEAERERYVLGNWEFKQDPNQLISYQWYKNCISANIETEAKEPIILAIDPARYGDDSTLFYYMQGAKELRIEEYNKQDTHETALLAIAKMQELGIDPANVIVDVIGLGAGVVDSMKHKDYEPVSFGGGESAESLPDFFKFQNKRCEAYWLLREDMRKGEIEIGEHVLLKKDLTNISYTSDEKIIKVEAKAEIKKRLGRSPDYGDALSMANWLRHSGGNSSPKLFML